MRQATYSQRHDEWTYSVEFSYDTCDLLTVTAIFSDKDKIRVITRYKDYKKGYDKTKPEARKPRKSDVPPHE